MGEVRVDWLSARDALFVAMFAAFSFIVENSLGLVLYPFVSGIPLVGGTLSAIPDSIIVFLGAFLIPRRGSILLFAVLLLTLSTITPSFGPPGLYKIAIGLGLGGLFELLLLIGRRPTVYVLATGVVFAASIPMTYAAWRWFGLPGVDALAPQIPLLMVIYLVEGLIGASLGLLLFNKRLSTLTTVRRLRDR